MARTAILGYPEQIRMSYRDRIYATYASSFQGSGGVFDAATAARWGRPFRRYFKGWLPPQKDAAIVDLACGGGKLLHLLKSMGYTNLQGVDISGEQVALARQVTPNVVEGNVIQYIRKCDQTYDLIVAQDIIEHLNRDEAMLLLDGCYKALRPGGRLILQTPNAESPWFGVLRYGDVTHEVVYTPGSLGFLMRLSGLEEIESRELGPVPGSAASCVRWLLWRFITLALKAWNLAETGHPGSGVFTRVFVIRGVRK